MNQSDESDLGLDFETARGRDWPSVRQFNVFVANRVGGLVDVVRRFEQSDNAIIALTVVDTTDCAIIRMVLRDTERAIETLEMAKLPYTESDILVVELPSGTQPLLDVFKALLTTEMNIHYAYPLSLHALEIKALALHVEDHETAVRTLENNGFRVFSENDLLQ